MDAKLLGVRMPHERVEVQWRRRLGHDAEANIVRSRDLGLSGWIVNCLRRRSTGKFIWHVALGCRVVPRCIATLNFQPQTRKNETKLPRPARPTANDQNHMPMGCLGQGGVTGPRPHTAPGGFVLEGVRGDNMATWKRKRILGSGSSFGVGGPPCQDPAEPSFLY